MNDTDFNLMAEENAKDVADISKAFKLLECRFKETQKLEPTLINKHVNETKATLERIKIRTTRMMQYKNIEDSYISIINTVLDKIGGQVATLENLIQQL